MFLTMTLPLLMLLIRKKLHIINSVPRRNNCISGTKKKRYLRNPNEMRYKYVKSMQITPTLKENNHRK